MGLLKLFFALLILIGHAKHYHFLPESLLPDVKGLPLDPKIDIFIMIAGFFSRQTIAGYIGSGERGWVRRFYMTRCVRLLPAYWVCFFATYLIVVVFKHHEYPPLLEIPISPLPEWRYWLQNLIPFLPDTLAILDLPYPWDTIIDRLQVFQAWTLAVLMVLFALAPAMMVGWRIYPLFIISLWIPIYTIFFYERFNGYVITSLPYYLAGAIAFDFYQAIVRRFPHPTLLLSSLTYMLLLAVMGMLLIYETMIEVLGILGAHTITTFYGLALLPYLYHITRGLRFDRYAGDISYPLYMYQFLVFFALTQAGLTGSTLFWAVIPACLLTAMALHHAVERPFIKLRRKWHPVSA